MRIRFSLFLAGLRLCAHNALAQDLSFRKITADNGLSHNTVYTIVQDRKGFMWFGTREGLNRYDSYTVKNYYLKDIGPGTTTNRISCLLSLNASIYIGTDNGLYKYEEQRDKINDKPLLTDHFAINCIANVDSTIYVGSASGFYRVEKDGNARLIALKKKLINAVTPLLPDRFLVASGRELFIINTKGEVINKYLINSARSELYVSNIFYQQETAWICTNDGLHALDLHTGNASKIKFTTDESAESNTVRTITDNGTGNLYIGTENGLYVYDRVAGRSVNYTQSFDNSPKKLNDKAIYAAYTAQDGSVWLGTYFGGVNYTPSVSYGFKSILANERPGALNGKAVSQMMEDNEHNIWIATEDGGISIYDPRSVAFSNINKTSKPFRLNINNVHAIYNDGSGSIWAGTFLGGLHRFEKTTGKTIIYTNKPGDTTSLVSDQVYAIYRDSKGTLWVGTAHGLCTFDYKTGRFHLFKPQLFGSSFIYDIIEDEGGDIWFCDRWYGLARYNSRTDKITRYEASGTRGSLPGNQVISVYKDSKNKLWFGTLDGGACRYNSAQNNFTVLNTKSGLPNNNVYGILEDDKRQMWFSTNRGLACYDQVTRKFTNYDSRYGLPSNQFNFKSFLKASDGRLYFGTIHGLCFFDPHNINVKPQQVPLRFTAFQVFNKAVEPGDGSLLSKPIDDVQRIDLKYAQNVFSIDFAALNYSNVRANNYTYYLEGLETKWNAPSGKNTVTYTSLSPGKYTFHLRALDVSGKPVSNERMLVINVAPPFYRSNVAFVIYALLLMLAIWLYTRFMKFLHTKELEVQLERMEKEKTAELTQHRLNFFTFISHEFKTPLTLIIASVEKFMGEHHTAKSSELTVIKSNASRLFGMIQQLMEFRKIETDHSTIKLSRNDLVKFTHDTVNSFQQLAQSKGLTLISTSPVSSHVCYFDTGKVEHILVNILSNAIKNTSDGSVSLDLNFMEARGQSTAAFVISDTGKGMSKKEMENVFQTFYKGIDSEEGSGVGMALVKNLVTYLNGDISLQSEPGKGTTVKLSLPMTQNVEGYQEVPDTKVVIEPVVAEPASIPTAATEAQPTMSGQTIMVIEDNKELQVFLAKHLGRNYNVVTASNGLSGWGKLIKQTPDLVLSDIRMPKMDGIELCRKIKSDAKYNHIPVVLLSDSTHENVKLDGLDVGADAYLAKPFNLKELDLLVANMIRSRVKLREQLLDMSKFGLDKLPRNNKDQEFLANLGTVLEAHYAHQQFTVEEMAASLNISRTLLHINLKKILDKSATQLLNEYRLKKAVLMLRSNLPINEVGYYTGYSDPNYFSRIFKKQYGVSPGAFKSAPDKYPEVV